MNIKKYSDLYTFLQPFFASLYKEGFVGGWDIYKPEEEFSRQGFPVNSWRFTTINENYEFCETYPKCVSGC